MPLMTTSNQSTNSARIHRFHFLKCSQAGRTLVPVIAFRSVALRKSFPGSILLAWSTTLDIYLVDGTYELFRHYYALPSARDKDGQEVAAVRGVLASVLGMIKEGATHVAVATDHVIESFRNGLWPGYKTSEGIEADLLAQFPLLEEVLSAAGVVVWPMWWSSRLMMPSPQRRSQPLQISVSIG
jgi:hypothetical protein